MQRERDRTVLGQFALYAAMRGVENDGEDGKMATGVDKPSRWE
jgi:hypothetical protein